MEERQQNIFLHRESTCMLECKFPQICEEQVKNEVEGEGENESEGEVEGESKSDSSESDEE